MTGDGKLDLYCRKCERLTLHTNLMWKERVLPRGRRITAKCSVCGYRNREGYIIAEALE